MYAQRRSERPSDGVQLTGPPLPEFVLEIIEQGGLLPKLVADGYIPTDPGRPTAPARS